MLTPFQDCGDKGTDLSAGAANSHILTGDVMTTCETVEL